MSDAAASLEAQRLKLQAALDAGRSPAERNRMGQFATPSGLAQDVLRYAKSQLRRGERVRFIDPAFGTGSFYSALRSVFPAGRIERAVGFEVDPHYGLPAADLWRHTGLQLHRDDFTRAQPPPAGRKFNLLICNPPYVRHHHIANGEKHRLRIQARDACGIDMNGLAGLYCYFVGLCHAWMEPGALAGWLIPSEFMDVNYGAALKRYLLDKVTLLHIHRFDPNDVQFADALVSSALVWFRKAPPPEVHQVRFTYGGSLRSPSLERTVPAPALWREPKWTHFPERDAQQQNALPALGDFFTIKRGLATGHNAYFILTAEEIAARGLPPEAFRPVLPSPRYLKEDMIEADRKGNPILAQRLFLLNCRLPEEKVRESAPRLWEYLQEGLRSGVATRYLCRHRSPWYAQEDRPPAPFICTYLGRSDKKDRRPFRFILNRSKATATNVYLMLYPNPPLQRLMERNPELEENLWSLLNEICPRAMLGEGRVYGGGLHKLEPKELAKVPAEEIAKLAPAIACQPRQVQSLLFEESLSSGFSSGR